MTPTRDPDPLEDLLRQAFANRAATTSVGEPRPSGVNELQPTPATSTEDDGDAAGSTTEVVALVVTPDPPRRARPWARPVAAAAVVGLLAGGLFVAGRLVGDRDGQSVANAPPDPAPACGDELPFTFPTPDGFEGPVPGPVTPEMEAHTWWNGIALRWQGESGIVDVSWSSYPPQDPATPVLPGPISITGTNPQQGPNALGGYVADDVPDDWFAQEIWLLTTGLGDGQCAALRIIVTGPTAEATESMVDHIAMGLVGPEGVVPGTKPTLIIGTTSIDAPPEIEPCGGEAEGPGASEEPDTTDVPDDAYGGPVDDQGTFGTPGDALANFLPTDLRLPQGGYEEATLPDGTVAFLFHPDPEQTPDFVSLAVYVDPVDGGWTVTSWESTGC